MSTKNSIFVPEPMEHPGIFHILLPVPVFHKRGECRHWNQPGHHQMEKSATFTLETAVHWLTAPTGEQSCRKTAGMAGKEHNAHSGTAVSSSRVKLEPQWERPCWCPAPFLGAVLPFPQSSLLQLEF